MNSSSAFRPFETGARDIVDSAFIRPIALVAIRPVHKARHNRRIQITYPVSAALANDANYGYATRDLLRSHAGLAARTGFSKTNDCTAFLAHSLINYCKQFDKHWQAKTQIANEVHFVKVGDEMSWIQDVQSVRRGPPFAYPLPGAVNIGKEHGMSQTERKMEIVTDDLKELMRDLEGLLKALPKDLGAEAHKVRTRIEASLEAARHRCHQLERSAFSGIRTADSWAHERPYAVAGATFGLGVLLGVLIQSRN